MDENGYQHESETCSQGTNVVPGRCMGEDLIKGCMGQHKVSDVVLLGYLSLSGLCSMAHEKTSGACRCICSP